ncbi:MAG TPA: YajQ family cyclic di-GMP-binding protein [Bacteroidota bacterium]|nr:YajQ family cyclic di-GMP-binding protein [Bacteroidota bacterium]
MAQQNSFDIVSEVNLQEVDNALNQATKEVTQRYDFKGIPTNLEFRQKERELVVTTGDDFHLKSAIDILQTKLIKRGIPLKSLQYGKVDQAPGGSVRQIITLQVGIGKEDAKTIVRLIKDSKIRVQAQIMEDQVRVSGKNKDDLQSVIALLRQQDFPFAMQFANYR